MGQVRFEKRRFGEFMRKQGIYIALAVCMLTAGLGVYAATHGNQGGTGIAGEVDKAQSGISASSATGSKAASSEKSSSAAAHATTSSPAAGASSSPPAAFWVMPVSGTVMKSFDSNSLQYSETYKDWRLHAATDIKAASGTAVFAAASGTVTAVYYDNMYGECVEIDHGDGVTARYCGLNRSPSVSVGDTVTAGKQLGAVDAVPCENVEPAHLHLVFLVDGVACDPMEIMGFLDTEKK